MLSRRITLLVACVLAAFVFVVVASSLGGEPSRPVEIRGRVLASFDEDHAIIESKSRLFRIKISKLSFLQRQKLKRFSSEIKLKIPADAIDLSWGLHPSTELNVPTAEHEPLPTALAKLQSHDGIVEIVGKRLPSVPLEAAFVQVNDRVYVIEKSKVPSESRTRLNQDEINIYVPQSSVLFSWQIESQNSKEVSTEKQEIKKVGGNFKIVGRSLYSFEEPYSLVQANTSVVQLRRSDLTAEQCSQLDKIGSTINIKVPHYAVKQLWQVREKSSLRVRLPASD